MSFELVTLLADAERRGASDLLLVPGALPMLRLHGDLTPSPIPGSALGIEDAAGMLLPYLPASLAAEFRAGNAVDFCFEQQGIGRFRCNLHRERGGVAASLRLLPEKIPDFHMLNLPPQVARLAEMHKGFVLVVGPTGAGKSTTLACLLDIINSRRAAHIVTIEDPVEYRHRHRRSVIEQIEIGTDAPSFASALRHTLRQDPDVILVGEMRDLETISIALTAAETGHLVLSSLHTNDTTQALDRMLDVFPAHQQAQVRQQLALSLTGVVAQHLIPTADGAGRVPAVEILLATDAVRNLIRTTKTHLLYSTIAMSRTLGMQTLEDALATLCKRKKITREDAMLRSTHLDELDSLLK